MKFRLFGAVLLTTTSLLFPASASGESSSVCPAATVGTATCHAKLLKRTNVSAPAGYGPAELRTAYGAALRGTPTVAVIGAYNDPTALADINQYNATFGLSAMPYCVSVAERGCFERFDQRGGQRFGTVDAGWAVETALDVETLHQLCPGCHLDLVEADDSNLNNLFAAVNLAVADGAKVVSMSWGGVETASETSYDAYFNHAGVTFVASSGDFGYGVSYPAASTNVIAVGGTSLTASASGWRGETVWSGTGSGCSKYEPKPSYQHDAGCAKRSVTDVSADADPATGAAIYTSDAAGGAGWYTVGGTSLAAPIVAGLIAGSGAPTGAITSRLYSNPSALHDVMSGHNGSCGTTHVYLCTAGLGYDGPTGNGSPASSSLW